MKKIAFLCLPGLENFVEPISKNLRTKYNTNLVAENSLYEGLKAIQEADIVWLEWANEMAWKITTSPQLQQLLSERQVIIRYHSYELFHHTPAKINWEMVDDVIFVAEHVKLLAARDLGPSVRVHHIPNGLDHNIFGYEGKLAEKENTRQLVLLGHLNHKKGLSLLAHCFCDLQKKSGREYHLHIAGDTQDKRYDHYFAHIFEQMGIIEDISFHNYVTDVPGFLQDKSHILCTSPWESQNLSVMEGMLCGLRPLVHNFPGSTDIYVEEDIWTTIDEFSELVMDEDWDPEGYRSWVVHNYALENSLGQIDKILSLGRRKQKEHGEVVAHPAPIAQ